MDGDYEDFIARYTNGWVVVYVGKENTPKQPLFVNVTGPYDDRPAAVRAAANMRARYKRDLERNGYAASLMVMVSVRPLWTTDRPR